MIRKVLLALVAIVGVFGVAYAANNWNGRDGSGAVVTFCSKDIGSGVEANCAVATDAVGNPLFSTDGTANQLVVCNQEAQYDGTTSGKSQVVALSSGKKVYVCGFSIFAAGTVNVDLTQGTGSNCNTGTNTKMSPTYQLTAQTGIVDNAVHGASTGPNVSIVSQALCIETSGGIAVQLRVRFAQF